MVIDVTFASTPPLFTTSFQNYPTAYGIRRYYYRTQSECSTQGAISSVTNLAVNYCVPVTTSFMPTTPQEQQYYLIESCTSNTQTATIYLNANCQTQLSTATTAFSDMGLDANSCGMTFTGSTYCSVNTTDTSTICPRVSPFYRNICSTPTNPPNNEVTVTTNKAILALVAMSFTIIVITVAFLFYINSKIDKIANNMLKIMIKTETSHPISSPINHQI